MDNRLKAGDWVLLDDWNVLARVDSFNYSDPSIVHLQLFEDDMLTYTFQGLRIKDHKITKITKEVADIMRSV